MYLNFRPTDYIYHAWGIELKNKLKLNINIKIKALAIYQVIGGVMGIISIVIEIVAHPDWLFGITGLLYLLATILFSFSVYCAYQLVKSKESGIYYSRINQCIQLLAFAVLGYGYSFASGLKLVLGIDMTNERSIFMTYSLSDWRFMINSDNDSTYWGVNVIALALLVLIENTAAQMDKHDAAVI